MYGCVDNEIVNFSQSLHNIVKKKKNNKKMKREKKKIIQRNSTKTALKLPLNLCFYYDGP